MGSRVGGLGDIPSPIHSPTASHHPDVAKHPWGPSTHRVGGQQQCHRPLRPPQAEAGRRGGGRGEVYWAGGVQGHHEVAVVPHSQDQDIGEGGPLWVGGQWARPPRGPWVPSPGWGDGDTTGVLRVEEMVMGVSGEGWGLAHGTLGWVAGVPGTGMVAGWGTRMDTGSLGTLWDGLAMTGTSRMVTEELGPRGWSQGDRGSGWGPRRVPGGGSLRRWQLSPPGCPRPCTQGPVVAVAEGVEPPPPLRGVELHPAAAAWHLPLGR